MEYILAHDFGTSADKAVLFSTEGQIIRSIKEPYPTFYQSQGWAEQDPCDWWKVFCKASRELLKTVEADKVCCVSFDGTAPNCLLVDSNADLLHRAMIWQDTRAYKEAQKISAALPSVYTDEYPENLIPTDRTLPKLLWMKEHHPELLKKAWKVLPGTVGYLILKLTGKAVCDRTTARRTALVDPATVLWSEEILRIADLSMDLMPQILESTEVAGGVLPEVAVECGLTPGTPVVVGAMDHICTSIGAGMIRPGDAYLNGGTSAEIKALDAAGNPMGCPTSSSGSSVWWIKEQIGLAELEDARQNGKDVYQVLEQKIEQSPPGSNGVIFHPYLTGARGVRNNPIAKGSFTGITLATSQADLIRSVVEGVGYNLNLLLEQIRKCGVEITRMPVVGGLGKSAVFRQIFADIMDVELVTFQYIDEAAAVGAAVLGGIAIGIYQDESEVKRFMQITSVTSPNKENHQVYQMTKQLFEAVYDALEPTYQINAEIYNKKYKNTSV